MMEMYRSRLDHLADTVHNLHQIVAKDQALSLMEDSDLAQYRIDRVNELVKDILES